jgi:hypothetical protein
MIWTHVASGNDLAQKVLQGLLLMCPATKFAQWFIKAFDCNFITDTTLKSKG